MPISKTRLTGRRRTWGPATEEESSGKCFASSEVLRPPIGRTPPADSGNCMQRSAHSSNLQNIVRENFYMVLTCFLKEPGKRIEPRRNFTPRTPIWPVTRSLSSSQPSALALPWRPWPLGVELAAAVWVPGPAPTAPSHPAEQATTSRAAPRVSRREESRSGGSGGPHGFHRPCGAQSIVGDFS